MPAQRNQRSTRPATTRAGSSTARRGNDGNGNGRRSNQARWQISRFKETYPWLIREDGTFAFSALHYLVPVLVNVEEAAVPLDESGTVAFVRLIKPPGVTDYLNP